MISVSVDTWVSVSEDESKIWVKDLKGLNTLIRALQEKREQVIKDAQQAAFDKRQLKLDI